MFKKEDVNVIRLGIKSHDPQQIERAVERLNEIEDKEIAEFNKVERKQYVLNFQLLFQKRDLENIALWFKKENINVSKFLPPALYEKGYSDFVFELEIPINADIDSIKKRLNKIDKAHLKEGELIDEILDKYLLKGLAVNKLEEKRAGLREALEIAVLRRMSMLRKDLKTLDVMHPIRVEHIFVNEIKIFDTTIIEQLAKELNITKDSEIDKLVLDILQAALLHDAVEDGDISKEELLKMFKSRVADIVLMLSKEEIHKNKAGEAIYLNNLVKRKDAIGLISQLIKIADRMHNLRTLVDNHKAFQRKVFFSILDTFIPVFIDEIDFKNIKNRALRKTFKEAVRLLKDQVRETGLDLEFFDKENKIIKKQWELYEEEEKKRQEQFSILEKIIKTTNKLRISTELRPINPKRFSVPASLLIQHAI